METSKACRDRENPMKITKQNADIFADLLLASFNDSVEKSNSPSSLKNENLAPTFKKDDRNSQNNYKPVVLHRFVTPSAVCNSLTAPPIL